ncbi:hypothetical protein M426DRAFT_106412 [Hypoxylon sp. CI-4A]|nr:hypothetical protein M426DRAFT_106412 [Hypoxylon sp. CI-4A]
MVRPRKRKRGIKVGSDSDPPTKKGKTHHENNHQPTPHHAVLNQFYPQVLTLRNYILSKLPATSRLRRKKVTAVGITTKTPDLSLSDVEKSLGALLDNTLIGTQVDSQNPEDNRLEGWKAFSQKGDESYVTLSNGVAGFVETQELLLEYVVRTLFSREKTSQWPKHLLCDGFSRNHGLGIRLVRANPHFEAVRQPPWPELLALMGESGERIMIDLLLDCAIFAPVKAGANNYCQISGR